MLNPTRRVITGIENNESTIIEDKPVDAITPYPDFPSFQLQNLFYTETNPQSIDMRHNDSDYDINIPPGAMRFMKLRMPTQKERIAEMTAAGMELPEDWHQFNMHATNTADYIYILSGHITHVVGEQSFELNPGDFLTQLGSEHTWINDYDEPCYLLCIMCGTNDTGFSKKMVVED